MQRKRLLLLVPLAAGAAVAAFFLLPPRSPIDALPADAFAVLTIDGDAMRASSLASTFHEYSREFAKLPAGCNVTLSERIDEAALAVAEGKPELGIALSGKLSEAELIACKEALQKPEAPKGPAPAASATVTEFDHGSFRVSKSDLSGRQMYVAWNRRGPLTLGVGPYTERMLDAVDGKVPRVGSAGDLHGELRASLKKSAKTRVGALLTVRPTAKLREEFLEYIPSGSFLERAKPLTTIAAFGLALVPGVKDGEAEFLAEARCDDEALCEKIKELVLRQRFEFGKNFAVRLGGFGPVLDNLTVTRDGKRLTVRTHDSAEALARNLAQAKSALSFANLDFGKPKTTKPEAPAPTISREPIPSPSSPGAPVGTATTGATASPQKP